jgi:hypothetical protein
MKSFLVIMSGCLFAAATCAADPPEDKTGLKLGEKAPNFKLKDQSGTERSLEAVRNDGPVALVFFRSAAW